MSQLESDPRTPATSPEFSIPVEPPGWPKAIGVFSIVWASLGIPCSGCMSIAVASGSRLYEWGRQKQIAASMPDTGPMPAVFQPTIVEIFSTAVWFLGVVVLLIGGIQVVRRRAAGRTIHLVYGVISICGTLVYTTTAIIKSRAIADWISHNPSDPYLKQPGVSFAGNPIIPLVVAVILLVYPTFVLIWFGLRGKRPEVGAHVEEPLV